jgi:hypothetical protein
LTDRPITRTERTLAAIADRLEDVDEKLARVLTFAEAMAERDAWVDNYRAHAQDGLPAI